MSTSLSISFFVYLRPYLNLCQPTSFLYTSLSLYLFVSLLLCLFIYLSIYLFVYRPLYHLFVLTTSSFINIFVYLFLVTNNLSHKLLVIVVLSDYSSILCLRGCILLYVREKKGVYCLDSMIRLPVTCPMKLCVLSIVSTG